MNEKTSKDKFLKTEKLQNHISEGKGKEKKKEEGEGMEKKRKKAVVAFLVFITTTLKIIFGRKKLLDAKGPFGDIVIKNPVRYTFG